ncbi:MAG: phosphoribosylglycinamide formyltransferase [Alphaproteobacteria bacterium]|nr:phosphoribosylglycinamide formyltransferase [Alphaproteobacteria bacterium]
MNRKRVAILISGRGSNMAALIAAAKASDYPAEIIGVISNTPSAAGLETARAEGLATAVIRLKDHSDKTAADAAISARLREWQVDLVCLAGFMRLLGPEFCTAWQGRVLNIHPALLPEFPGLDTHARALAAGVAEHGCTVHFVTAGMDEGPIVGQARVPVLAGDTPETLAARVLAEEHRLYADCLAKVARGEIAWTGQ